MQEPAFLTGLVMHEPAFLTSHVMQEPTFLPGKTAPAEKGKDL